MHIDALSVLCAQLTRDLLAIGKFMFFSGSHTGQTHGWIFTRDSSKDVKLRKDVPFWGLSDAHLSFGGVKSPQKTEILGRE